MDIISYTKAKKAQELAQQIIDGSFDTGVLNTNIEQRLLNLETQYAPDLSQVKSDLAQIATNLTSYITSDLDVTNAFVDAIAFLNSKGGGILNIPYKNGGYNITTANIHLCNNLIINGNGNELHVSSGTVNKNVFDTTGLSNVTMNDLKIISTNDQTRTAGRSGLGSNVYGIIVKGNHINLSNVYFECLESGIWTNDSTATTKNVTAKNLESYKTKQPLFLFGISHSSFVDLKFDCTDSATDTLDHQIYINGKTDKLSFDNLIFTGGSGTAISLKSDSGTDLNKNLTFKNVEILDSTGVYLTNAQHIVFDNLKVENPAKTTSYGITIQGTLNKHITINNFYINGYGSGIATGTTDNLDNVKFFNGFVTGYASNAVTTTKCTNVVFDSVTFKNSPIDTLAYIFYTSPTSVSQLNIKNCKFVFDVKPTRFLFSFRGTDQIILENSECYNNGVAGGNICYSLSPAKVITKNNYHKGFTNFKDGGDTATTEYTNVAIV